jgi:hypothetical protein
MTPQGGKRALLFAFQIQYHEFQGNPQGTNYRCSSIGESAGFGNQGLQVRVLPLVQMHRRAKPMTTRQYTLQKSNENAFLVKWQTRLS